MPRNNIVHYSLRLNLNNEQHQRINGVLRGLNKSIYKSTNQFIADAIDYYINNFGREQITNEAIPKPEDCKYITKEDLRKAKDEIYSGVKDEMIRLLSATLAGSHMDRMQPTQTMKQEKTGYRMEEDTALQSLVEKWG